KAAALAAVTAPARASGRTARAAAGRGDPADAGRSTRLEQECARLAAQVDELRARLAEAEAGAAHEQRVREELETALQRGAGAGQQELHTALEAARRAEAARAVLAAENAALAAQLEHFRDGNTPIDVDVNAEVDRLRARL